VFSKLSTGSKSTISKLNYEANYYRNITLQGRAVYSSIILLPQANRIVIDDKNITKLEKRIIDTLPATIYSRALAAG
jgi:hypothetical protein